MQREITVIDIETQSITQGEFDENGVLKGYGCTVPWEGNIIGVGLCWGGDFETETAYYSGEQIAEIMEWLAADQVPLVAYNALFEVSWLSYHFEHLKFNWVGDSALTAIALDNSAASFSLKDTAVALVQYPNWEQEISNYCVREFKAAPSKWGKFIPWLPYEMLSDYCRKDCHSTYLIWQAGCEKLNIDHIHAFFLAEVLLTSQAYLLGTCVDMEKTQRLHDHYKHIVENVEERFISHPDLLPHIEVANRVRYERHLAQKLGRSKTGVIKPVDYSAWLAKEPFKCSNPQLVEVFKSQKLFFNEERKCYMWPELTPGGAPCLDADHIHLYGVGGQILSEAGQFESKYNKLKHLGEDAQHDGRVHFDINLCSVRSTRVSSNGLNIVATPLDSDVGECFVADDGWSFVLPDFTQLEPSLSAILSDDEMLKYCSFTGVGKVPHWKNDLLYIDDAYLYYLSGTSRWSREIKQHFSVNEWMDTPEKVKKKFKQIRQAGKKIVLMTQYGSGIDQICSSMLKELGIHIDSTEGKQLLNTLWAVFPGLYRYVQRLRAFAKAGTPIKTWLGFPIATSSQVEHCVFNYRVQTEAAHTMKQFLYHILSRKQDWFVPIIPNIHDACCFMVQDERITQFKQVLADSLADLNDSLAPFTNGLNLRIETHVGKTLREAKEG